MNNQTPIVIETISESRGVVIIPINSVSVKVMRSYDYCHFEVSLSSDLSGLTRDDGLRVSDELRKSAARLADKAVEQYKTAKENAMLVDADQSGLHQYDYHQAVKVPEDQLTPEQKAVIKAAQDCAYRRRRYDYEDSWQEPDYDDD